MVDHPSQLSSVKTIASTPGSHKPLVFIKIDASYGRAGVIASSPACEQIIDAVLAAETEGSCVFHGLYCHAGHSYSARADWDAMHTLAAEFSELKGVAAAVDARKGEHKALVLSVGATPTATTIQHPLLSAMGAGNGSAGGDDAPTGEIEKLLGEMKAAGYHLEVHAGV
jgi:D-serine deaminase-like pyridoxal phosphate-dependent protein